MKTLNRMIVVVSGCALALVVSRASAQDWPQWRGPNRDAKAANFAAPKAWPKELTQKWKVTVGEGVATPALVGDKLYVFARQEGSEITRCLDAATGKELWQDKYESAGATGPASGFSGPRGSPAVADGKVVTHGVRGVLSCLDAATPIVDGPTMIYGGSGRGTTAVKFEKQGDGLVAKELWKNPDNSVQFNTPVLKNGLLFGLSARNDFFCI
jgi:outer membrane protein assembly factor BamB